MSKKSRTSMPGDPDRANMTVIDSATQRLDGPGSPTMATSDPDGTMVTRVPGPATGDEPTAMLDAADVAKVLNNQAPPSRPLPPPPVAAKPPEPARAPANLANANTIVAPLPKDPGKQDFAKQEPSVPTTGALGLDIVMRWSGEMHKARFFPLPTAVTIGEDGVFALPDDVMGGKKLDTLVQQDPKDGFALTLSNPAIRGQIIVGSDVYSIADIKAGGTALPKDRVPLTAKTHAFVEFGDFTFVLSRGAVPKPARPSLWDKEDWLLVAAFALSAIVILGPIVASFQMADPRARRKMNYVEQLEERVAQIIEVENKIEEKPEDKAEDKQEEKQPEKQEQPVAPQKIEQAQINKQADQIKKALDAATPEQREEMKQKLVAAEVDKATEAVNQALDNVPTTKLAALGDAADSDIKAGGGAAVVLDTGDGPSGGPRKGPEVGGANDAGKQVASGLEKQGTGGPGPKLTADVKAPAQKVIRMGGQQSADGELPPDVIKKVLADKSGAIKACYQRELQSNPDLSGAVKVKFVIGPNGAVVGVKIESSTLGNAKVDECIEAIIKLMRFPQAKNGGVTTVNKTFQFKSS
ncbi:MAG: TonB family protein [Deltaproteobacteria bacterium]|nr:TonB family protein [Deltaproteobacteria bacterium]